MTFWKKNLPRVLTVENLWRLASGKKYEVNLCTQSLGTIIDEYIPAIGI